MGEEYIYMWSESWRYTSFFWNIMHPLELGLQFLKTCKNAKAIIKFLKFKI